MGRETCANYEPVEPERPTNHPNRIFAEDLRVGMVIRRHGRSQARQLAVVLEVPTPKTIAVKSLQFLAGYQPAERFIGLAASGLKPYLGSGAWAQDVWCEEVT